MKKRMRNSAFTLVELLVVIGIIAIMIGILIPTLTRVREHASLVKCSSNLREIHTMLQIYAQRYKDKYPDPWTLGGANYRAAPGFVTAGSPFDPTNKGTVPETQGLAAVFEREKLVAGNSTIWKCPAANDVFQQWGQTYAFNIFPNSYWKWGSLLRGRDTTPPPVILTYRDNIVVQDNYSDMPYYSGVVRQWSKDLGAPITGEPAQPFVIGGWYLLPHRMTSVAKLSQTSSRTVRRSYNTLTMGGEVSLRGVYNPTKIR